MNHKKTYSTRMKHPQRGSSMLLVLLFLMVLSAAGMGMMFASSIDTSVGANYRSSLAAYYSSKAGLEEARDRMRSGSTSALALPSTMPTNGGTTGVVYITNSDGSAAVQPWLKNTAYFDDELCHENFPNLGISSLSRTLPCATQVTGTYYTTATSVDANTGTSSAAAYKWVRVTLKQSGSTNPYCDDGTCASANSTTQVCADSFGNEVLLPAPVPPATTSSCVGSNYQPVYMITSMALNSTGAKRITQEEVAAVIVPPLPGALVLDGGTPAISTPHSDPYGINGNNANSCAASPVPASLPAIGTTSAADATAVGNSLFRPANYTGVNGTTPDVQNVSSSLGLYSTVGGLQTIVAAISNIADQTYTPGVTSPPTSMGSATQPLITVVNGDFSTCSGFGILVVTGALTCGGNYTWTGTILVIGKGTVAAANGGGNGLITGGVLVANLYDHSCGANDNSCNSNHILAPTSAPGTPSFAWNGGGSNSIQYDSCFTTSLFLKAGYKVLANREEMY